MLDLVFISILLPKSMTISTLAICDTQYPPSENTQAGWSLSEC